MEKITLEKEEKESILSMLQSKDVGDNKMAITLLYTSLSVFNNSNKVIKLMQVAIDNIKSNGKSSSFGGISENSNEFKRIQHMTQCIYSRHMIPGYHGRELKMYATRKQKGNI